MFVRVIGAAEGSQRFINQFKQKFGDRLLVLPREANHEKYLATLAACDVNLDSVNYSGGLTSVDAMTASLPTVTWPGDTYRSRQTLGQYRAMGFADLVASSAGEYVDLAVRLGTDRQFNQRCREQIAERSGVMFGRTDFADNLTKFITDAIERES